MDCKIYDIFGNLKAHTKFKECLWDVETATEIMNNNFTIEIDGVKMTPTSYKKIYNKKEEQ